MGADIHLVVERKWNGKWVGVHNFPCRYRLKYTDNNETTEVELFQGKFPAYTMDWWVATNRNYALFAEVAGVRGDGPEPRGFPADASELAEIEMGGDNDLHSHTWLDMREALAVWMKHYAPNLVPLCLGETRDMVLHIAGQTLFGVYFDDEIDNYRLVIAFDN